MSVRPWETPFLGDASLRDGLKSPKSELGTAMDVPTSPLFSTERRPMSSIRNGKLSNTIKVFNDGCTPSPRKLANAQETPTTPVSSKSPRTPGKDSRPTIGSRSFSTPRERSNLSDNQDKKRLSLPGNSLSLSLSFTHTHTKILVIFGSYMIQLRINSQSNEHLSYLRFLNLLIFLQSD